MNTDTLNTRISETKQCIRALHALRESVKKDRALVPGIDAAIFRLSYRRAKLKRELADSGRGCDGAAD